MPLLGPHMNRMIKMTMVWIVMITCLASAQNYDMTIQTITIGDGLSQNSINCIMEDDQGFLWMGTEDGLNRYDGYNFKIFRHNPWDSTSISSNTISALCQDRKGNIWIGTKDSGLNLFDRKKLTFLHFPNDPNNPHSLSHNSIMCITEDQTGAIWIGTQGGGINQINSDSLTRPSTFKRFMADAKNPKSITDNFVNAILEDPSGRIWVGTEAGLDLYDREIDGFSHQTGKTQDSDLKKINFINCLYHDREGILWIGTNGDGLFRGRIDSAGKIQPAITQYKHGDREQTGLSSSSILSLYEDKTGHFWVGTENGLHLFDKQKEDFYCIQNDPDKKQTLSNNYILSIHRDRSDVLWIGTERGLNKCYLQRKSFAHYKHNPQNPASLSNNYVWAFCEDRFGRLWVGTNGGLNRFLPSRKTFKRYINHPKYKNSISRDYVLSIVQDEAGSLWIGTNGAGLDKMVLDGSGEVSRFIHYKHDSTDPFSPASDYIMSLYVDREGTLWLGTWEGDIDRLDPQDQNHDNPRFKHILNVPDDAGTSGTAAVYVFFEDRSGGFWVGTDGRGLLKMDKETGAFQSYQNDPSDPNSLSHNSVMAIHEDSLGVLWIATYGGGLNRFDPIQGTFKNYTVDHGLPNNILYAILEDGSGNLWISSNNGLSKFNPASETFQNYTMEDGLQGYEFNSNAALKRQNGEFLFGGLQGFNQFHPDSMWSNPYIPPVYITDLKLFNQPVGIGQAVNGKIPLKQSIVESPEIELSFRDNSITLEFAALNYLFPEKNHFKYIMENLDKKWSQVGDRRFASYSHIPPGTYTFRLLASNNNNVWNTSGAAINIHITPPFWQTLWFKSITLLCVAVSIIGIYLLRTAAIRNKNRELQERVEEAIKEVKTLHGLLPICASCKKIRDDKGYWQQVDVYVRDHTQVEFSHSICPDCIIKLYPDFVHADEEDSTKK
jgi:ligand-binding sensor domain-containing protein